MSTTTDAEVSLINDLEFLDELERFDPTAGQAPSPELDSPTYADAFDALESGLPVDSDSRPAAVLRHERARLDESYEPVEEPAAAEKQVPFLAAALVLVVCLTAGAATAALVFHDRLAQITALRSANR